ncbi:hypothetical protein ACE1SV_67610 [Streptomyces sp. E-15]
MTSATHLPSRPAVNVPDARSRPAALGVPGVGTALFAATGPLIGLLLAGGPPLFTAGPPDTGTRPCRRSRPSPGYVARAGLPGSSADGRAGPCAVAGSWAPGRAEAGGAGGRQGGPVRRRA